MIMRRNKINILVLGADGFIGSNLTRVLLKEKKYQIRAFDLFKDGQSRNLGDIRNKIEIFPGNFLNKDDLRKALRGIDYVFHFISLTTPGSSMNDPLIDVETNVKGTIVLLDECIVAKVKRVIFSSSGGAIYGNQGKKKYNEADPVNPISPYAISKLAIEKYLEYYKIHRGLDYLVLRYSNPYGPGQNIIGSQGIIPIFLNLIKEGSPVNIFGNGENFRDYIFIDDAVAITSKIFSKELKFSVYNIGCGSGTSINDVVRIMQRVTKKEVLKNHLSVRDIDVKSVALDIERVTKEAGDMNFTSFEKGIKKTWEWICQL
jgi:UDP-glucose 4-epimerase